MESFLFNFKKLWHFCYPVIRATGSLNKKALFVETLNKIGLTNISVLVV